MGISFSDEEEIINLSVNSVRWATFAKIIRRLKSNITINEVIKTEKVLTEIGKQVNM